MTNALKEAVAEAENLPLATQEKIGEELLLHIQKLNRLRGELQKGVSSLERGEGRELDIEEVLDRAHAQYEKDR